MKIICIFFLSLIGIASWAQTQCSGTPASNTVLPLNHTICVGEFPSMHLAYTYSQSGITYQWQESSTSQVGPFNNIPFAQSSFYSSTTSVSVTMYYNVIVTCTNGVQSATFPHVVSIANCTNTVGFNDIREIDNHIRIYPNPNSGEFTIANAGAFGERLAIFDLTGREVSSITLNSTETKVNITNLSPGLYFLQLWSGDIRQTAKIFRE